MSFRLRGAAAPLAIGALFLALCCGVATARANTPIYSFEAAPSTTQAGGHPDIYTGWKVGDHSLDKPGGCDCSDAKNFIFDNPTGVIGDPHATPQCSQAEFATATCPVDTQIGVATVNAAFRWLVPVFNLEPTPNNAGLLGFTIPIVLLPVYEIINPRTESDYGLNVSVLGTPLHGFTPTTEVFQRLWGVPASAANNHLRFPFGQVVCASAEQASEIVKWTELGPHCGGEFVNYNGTVVSNSPAAPFISNPTTCGVSLSASLRVDSYDGESDNATVPWPATTGCDELSFNPSLYAQPTTTQTDSPSGIDVNLQVPQQESPTVPSPSEIRAATVKLPEGFSINAGAADGKTACADAEAKFETEEEAQCPDFSKVGSLTIETSALPGPLPGFVYLGQPLPGNRYRIFLTANGFGVHVKLAGVITPDPESGQLVISFKDLPQTPFSDFDMHFFGSERGLLATPIDCGTYPVESTFTPWDSELPEQSSVQYFTLNSGPGGAPCPTPGHRPFQPGLLAGVADSTAGQHSPFTLELTRKDGDQNLSSLSVTMPPGFLATLKGIPYCSDAALAGASAPDYSGLQEEASPSCPSASHIGSSVTGAGAGTHPLYTDGQVYLAGPYKGAPLSLAVIIPAVSGPYDLGNVVVRAALQIDPETTQITAVSDPLPQIIGGIPLRLREIRIELDRAGFTLNPTSCHPFSVTATVSGDQGAQANLSYPFQVGNCASLAFAPKLHASLSGATHRAGNPALHTTVDFSGNEANIKEVAVTLPPTDFIDNAHIQNPCTKVQFKAGASLGEKCPAGSLVGNASADTPLLDKPLEGPVYFRSAPENKSGLPDIVAVLKGQIEVILDGKIDTIKEKLPDGESVPRIRTTFGAVPDAPVSKFSLSLDGGKKGLLQNSANICSTPQHLNVKMVGQNGVRTNANPLLGTPCHTRSNKAHRAQTNRGARG